MDRQIVYIGQVPMDTDVLDTNLFSYIGLAKLAAGLLGTSTQLNGLACTPTGPASMQVNIGPGEIYELAEIDTTSYGSILPDSRQILKQGINLDTTLLAAMTAPPNPGESVNNLIQFRLTEADTGDQVLPYYNSANPSQAFAGPGNNAQPNFTIRADSISINVKAGTPAPTGTQVTPTPDTGYVGGWVVTIANGQTTITSGDITLYTGAPFIPAAVGDFVTKANLQKNTYLYSSAGGSANTLTATLAPAPAAYTTGMIAFIKATATNTGAATLNLNGLGAKTITYKNGSALLGNEIISGGIYFFSYDGTNMQILNPSIYSNIQNSSYTAALDTGSANAYLVALAPAITAYTTGLLFTMKVVNSNTGASTVNVNSLGTKNIKLTNGSDPHAGALLAGAEVQLFYDGTNFQILNPSRMATQLGIQSGSYDYAADTGSANTYAIALSPAVTGYAVGQCFKFKSANANSGASTLNVNSLGAKNILTLGGAALVGGEIKANSMVIVMYDGTQFLLIDNDRGMLKNVQVFTTNGTYTPTTGCTSGIVICTGGGGGGGGTGTGPGAAANGNASSFGALCSATGGSAGGAGGAAGGTGGTGSGGTFNFLGGAGGAFVAANNYSGFGGSSFWGSMAGPVGFNLPGQTGGTNTGGGGSGGGGTAAIAPAGGGGGGGTAILFTTNLTSQTVTVAAAAAGGTLGTGGQTGGSGARGVVVVFEFT